MVENLVTYPYAVTREDRLKSNGHNSFLILFTGLSGAGKSTLANNLEHLLFKKNIKTFNSVCFTKNKIHRDQMSKLSVELLNSL